MSRAPDLSHCGGCGADGLRYDGVHRHDCPRCGWRFYRNPAAAAFAILECAGRLLLVRRGREPGIGLLDLPGGFVDAGESAEAGLARELLEELGVQVTSFTYFGTYPNVYPYAGITYDTLDLCFVARLEGAPERVDGDEISGFVLCRPHEVDLERVAFESVRRALREYLQAAI